MRLQPLHLGHIRLIEEMRDKCHFVTILIGSALESRTDKNPFNYFERYHMLRDEFPKGVNIIPLKDINKPDIWVPFTLGVVASSYPNLPIPDAYFGGCEEDVALFRKQSKLTINIISREQGDSISATKIRKSLQNKTDVWMDLTPKSIHGLLLDYFQRDTL